MRTRGSFCCVGYSLTSQCDRPAGDHAKVVPDFIGGLRRLRDRHRLTGEKLRRINAAITYYKNNREQMRYDEYLAAGYPIGSGVAEGACRHLVKDRMEGAGMRWTVPGAQAMLHLRAVYLNGRWEEFIEYHVETEQDRLYGKTAA